MRITCLADSDTRLKWTLLVAAEFDARLDDVHIEVVVLDTGAAPSPRQLAELRVPPGDVHQVDDHRLETALDLTTDIVICCLVGTRLARLLQIVRDHPGAARPVVVTGYAGVVYEKHPEGALWRVGADVVCCNSETDRELLGGAARAVGLPADNFVRTGLATVQHRRPVDEVDWARPVRTLVFAVQPDVPRSRSERVHLMRRFADYAVAHPDRNVVVKLRSRPDEKTTHPEPYHYEKLYRRDVVPSLGSVPTNLRFAYGLMSEVLSEADLLVTVSSTAALEALAAGVPAAIVSDFGVRGNLGNVFFLGSGLLRSTTQLIADDLPTPDLDWLRANGFGEGDRFDEAVSTAVSLLDDQASRGSALPARAVFYDAVHTPYAMQQLAAQRAPRPASFAERARARTRQTLRGPLADGARWLDRKLT